MEKLIEDGKSRLNENGKRDEERNSIPGAERHLTDVLGISRSPRFERIVSSFLLDRLVFNLGSALRRLFWGSQLFQRVMTISRPKIELSV